MMQVPASYRQSAAQSAQPVRLVILLYDQLITDLRNASTAIQRRDIQTRAKEMDHAFAILGQLQGTLDYGRGGEIAQNLDRFYNLVRLKLLEAQLEDSPELLIKQIENVLSVREAWREVELRESVPATGLPGEETRQSFKMGDWNG